MKRYAQYLMLALASLAAPAAFAESFDWPQIQGPERNSVSKETGLLKEWPKDGPKLVWELKDLGGGYSAPSVAAGRIFGMSNRGKDEVIWALSETDGKSLWTTRLGAAFSQQPAQGKEGPACTPTVDGDRLYTIGLTGDINCLQVSDGKVLWTKSMATDFGARLPTWSFRESPLVDGDKVICTPGGPDATMVALDKMTGKTIWKSKAQGSPKASYASTLAIEFQGQRQYVEFTQNALIGVAASDGKFLWEYKKPANSGGINCSTVVYQDGQVFASSAYGAGAGMAKLTKGADGTIKAEEVYATNKLQNHHGGMVLVDGCLYGANGGNEGGYLVCLDFQTGKVLWDGRDDSERRAPKGCLAMADGRIYYRTEAGAMLLVEPNSKQYVERGRFAQPDRSKLPAWPHPVLANGKLYLRDQDVLLCYDIKAK